MTPMKTTKTKLPPNPFMHEILELVDEQKTKAKKVSVLKENRDDALTAILIWQFDENGQLVPDEIVAVRFENYDTDTEEDDD